MISSHTRIKRRSVRRLLRQAGGNTALEYAVLLGSVVVVLVLTLVSLAAHVGLSYDSISANVAVAPAARRATSGLGVTSKDGAHMPGLSATANDRNPDSPSATAFPR